MAGVVTERSAMKLSICITTFNRASFIGATLESILPQLGNGCEVVVLDGASTDDTARVVSKYAHDCDRLRYIEQNTNNGIDRDYDRVVQIAGGEYCWLMTDDDLLKPGAVATVLKALHRNFSLIIVNAEFMDLGMEKILQSRWLDLVSDRTYCREEMNCLFEETGNMLSYIGGVVIKRAIWLARERERYYGSQFIHFGVIFQEPLPGDVLVIAEPFISNRVGNTHTFSSKMFETLMIKWPSIVWSMDVSESAKMKICNTEPWRRPRNLLWFRALGSYSLTEYRQWIRPQSRSIREAWTPALVAIFPGVLINSLYILFSSIANSRDRAIRQQLLKDSRFYVWRRRRRSRGVPRV